MTRPPRSSKPASRSAKNPKGVSREYQQRPSRVQQDLKYALDIEVVDSIPRIKTLKADPQKFDFFTFEEFGIARGWHAADLWEPRQGGTKNSLSTCNIWVSDGG
jgi:hypothetical protein